MGQVEATDAPGHPGLCRHCGLATAGRGAYCCYGCELAAEIAAEGAKKQVALKASLTFSLLLSMSVMMLSLFLFAEDVYPDATGLEWMRGFYRWASAILATPVVALLGIPLLARSWRALRTGRATMELLVGAGAMAAWGLSMARTLAGKPGVYFDSATSALLLATLGRYLEATARARASRLIGPTLDLAAAPVRVDGEGGASTMVAPATLDVGATFHVPPEATVPVDATVLREVEVHLGALTGTPAPVVLAPGDFVPAGAVPVSGELVARVVRPARESTLERLADLAKSLHERPAAIMRLSDTFAAWLSPVVWALALGTLAVHVAARTTEAGIVASLAVVLAACPCTYGVTTPLVLWLAIRRALELGVCVRGAATLERLAGVSTVAFDKTGTLTSPDLDVLAVDLAAGVSRDEAMALVLGLEDEGRHPVARALARAARREGATAAALVDRRLVVGKGVVARDGAGRRVCVGSAALAREQGAVAEDGARVALARGPEVLATFQVGERPRAEARDALAALAGDRIATVMLTGDRGGPAGALALDLGLDVRAELSPEGKVGALAELGERVAMVGDGLNDAPALAGAASFAMGGGTGLARGMAQVTLLREDLRLVPWTLALARRSMHVARRNLVLSTAYNLLFLGLAAAGALRPVWAGLSMLGASLLTLALSLGVGAFPAPRGVPVQLGAQAHDEDDEARPVAEPAREAA